MAIPTPPTTLAVAPGLPPASGDYPYFQEMIARPDCFVQYSLRDPAQLIQNNGASAAPWVTYDTEADASHAVIPPFRLTSSTTLAADIDAVTEDLVFAPSILIQSGRAYKLDTEIVVADRVTPGVYKYRRHQYGTAATAHIATTPVYPGCTSLGNQVRLPVGATAGHTHFFGWEGRHNAAMLDHGFKTWQFSLQPNQRIFFEPQHSMPQAGGGVGARIYAPKGGNLTDDNPMGPRVGTFTITADRWFRIWAFIDQRPSIPLFTLWAGDAVTGPILLFDGLQGAYVPNFGPTIDKWWLEYNTSSNIVDAQLRTLHAWNRNFFGLRDLEQANVPLSVDGLVP